MGCFVGSCFFLLFSLLVRLGVVGVCALWGYAEGRSGAGSGVAGLVAMSCSCRAEPLVAKGTQSSGIEGNVCTCLSKHSGEWGRSLTCTLVRL